MCIYEKKEEKIKYKSWVAFVCLEIHGRDRLGGSRGKVRCVSDGTQMSDDILLSKHVLRSWS